MKYTNYFLYTRQRIDRKDIKLEWIKRVHENPDYQEIQSDGRIRKWGFIKELSKYLRIVVLQDNKTIHNAFFGRNFKMK